MSAHARRSTVMTTAGFELSAGDAMAADLEGVPASFLYRDVTHVS